MSEQISSALERKITASQDSEGGDARAVLKALRLSLARAAGDCIGLPLSVIGVRQKTCAQDKLTEFIENDWLMLMLASGESTAAVCLDQGLVSAIVQQQTICSVLDDEPEPRALTDTDAAMVVPLVENTLKRASALVETPADKAALSGLEFTTRAPDRRALVMGMIDDGYRICELTVELAGGARQGRIRILLPEHASEANENTCDAADYPRLDQASGAMRAELNAVIGRLSLPLTTLTDLSVGDILPLTDARLDRVAVLSIDGKCAAFGRLGQCRGMRAIRVNESKPPAPLLDENADRFLASNSPRADGAANTSQDGEEPNLLKDPEMDCLPADMATVDSLALSEPDHMLAEITQLAGLSDPDRS